MAVRFAERHEMDFVELVSGWCGERCFANFGIGVFCWELPFGGVACFLKVCYVNC